MAPRQKYEEISEVHCMFTSDNEMEIPLDEAPVLIEDPRRAIVQNHVTGPTLRMLIVLENDTQMLLTYDIPDENCTVQDLLDLTDLSRAPSRYTVSQVTDPLLNINYIVEFKDDENELESPASPENPYNTDPQYSTIPSLISRGTSPRYSPSYSTSSFSSDESSERQSSDSLEDSSLEQRDSPESPTHQQISSPQQNTENSALRSPKNSGTPKCLHYEDIYERDSPLSPQNIFDRGLAPFGSKRSDFVPLQSSTGNCDKENCPNAECPLKASTSKSFLQDEIYERDSPLSPQNSFDRGLTVNLNEETPTSQEDPFDRGLE